jgi:hypothetical protein
LFGLGLRVLFECNSISILKNLNVCQIHSNWNGDFYILVVRIRHHIVIRLVEGNSDGKAGRMRKKCRSSVLLFIRLIPVAECQLIGSCFRQ